MFKTIEDARRRERSQYGETVYLLEPNIKRSRGVPRRATAPLARFYAVWRDRSRGLQLKGGITKEDQSTIRQAWEFLLRLRNEMHFHAGKSNDVLDKGEQLRLAQLYGYEGTDGILPVEQFMSDYFRHTSGVRAVVGNFVASVAPDKRGAS